MYTPFYAKKICSVHSIIMYFDAAMNFWLKILFSRQMLIMSIRMYNSINDNGDKIEFVSRMD